jgi:hypothetical protein
MAITMKIKSLDNVRHGNNYDNQKLRQTFAFTWEQLIYKFKKFQKIN